VVLGAGVWVLRGLGSVDAGVLCAGMWVLRGLGSVDANASYVHRHVCEGELCAQTCMWVLRGFGFVDASFVCRHEALKRLMGVLMRVLCIGMFF